MISRKKKVAKRVVKRAIVRKNPDSGLRLKEDLIAFIKHKKKSADASTSSFLDDLLIQIEDVSPYHIDDLIIDFVIKENIYKELRDIINTRFSKKYLTRK